MIPAIPLRSPSLTGLYTPAKARPQLASIFVCTGYTNIECFVFNSKGVSGVNQNDAHCAFSRTKTETIASWSRGHDLLTFDSLFLSRPSSIERERIHWVSLALYAESGYNSE